MVPFFTVVLAGILLQTCGLNAATIPVISETAFNHSVPSTAPPSNTTNSSTTQTFLTETYPVPGTHVKLDILESTSAVLRSDLLSAIETVLVTIVYRMIDFGPQAFMTPGYLRYERNGVVVEIASRGAGSMTWVDLTATLWGILDLTTRMGYTGRAFKIYTNTNDWIGNGRFYSRARPPPQPLPGGSNQPSQTS